MGIKMLRLPGPGKNLIRLDDKVIYGSATPTSTISYLSLKYSYCGAAFNGNLFGNNINNVKLGTNSVSFKTAADAYGFGFFVKVEKSTPYVLSYVRSTNTALQAVSEYKVSGSNYIFSKNLRNNVNANSIKFTTSSDASFVLIILCHTGPTVGTTVTFTDIQLEEGSTKTDFEPYQEYLYKPGVKIPLRYLYAIADDTVNYPSVLSGYAAKVFTGKETADYNSSVTGLHHFSFAGVKSAVCCSTHYVYSDKPASAMPDKSFVPAARAGSSGFSIRDTDYPSSAAGDIALKAYLTEQYENGTPFTVLYKVAGSDGGSDGGFVWNFVKDTKDNVFGYLRADTNEFIKAYGATGTISETVYKHYMLKGGNT